MKRIFVMISILAFMLICSIQVSAISGEGTEESPYLITNEAELFLVKDFPDSHFALMNDVYVSDTSKDLGTFTGVFDGNNHTIDVGFITNKGKIRNVNFENSSVLSDYNYGEIENCRVIVTNNEKSYDNIVCYQNSGTIRAVDVNVKNGNLEYSSGGGGVARYNYGTIEKCSFVSENTYFESTYPYAGIAYQNNGVITKCCSKLYSANFERVITQYKTYTASFYGISYDNSYGTIEDCYVRLACINSVYSGLSASYKNCYYVINNTSGSVNGVSKSLLAMTMKATYAGWDFDRIWAINPEVNDGYPYFQWEDIRKQVSYPYANIEIGAVKSGTKIIISSATEGATIYYTLDGSTPSSESIRYTEPLIIDKNTTVKVIAIKDGMRDSDIKEFKYTIIPGSVVEPEKPVVLDYTINSLRVTDGYDNVLESIPETESCYAEINITKNTDRNEKDYLIIGSYDANGALIDFTFMRGLYNQNQEITFGALLKNQGIKTIKAFVWDGISSMTPLSNVCIYE